MRASHKKRLARLMAPLDAGDQSDVDARNILRTAAPDVAYVRAAMDERGFDPTGWPMFRHVAEKVAGFVDTSELQAADAAFNAKYETLANRLYWEEQARKHHEFVARVAEKYRDGHLPPPGCSFDELLAWAVAQDPGLDALADEEAAGADRENPPSQAGEESAA